MDTATPEVTPEIAVIATMITTEATTHATKTKPRSVGFYRQALKSSLDPEIFKPNPMRLIGFFTCAVVGIASFLVIVNGDVSWPVKLLCGLLLGFCNGTLGFICHELAHGSIVKSRGLQTFLAFFGQAPFLISPTYWKFSHNRLHHGSAQKLIEDPDAFPNLRIFKASKFMKFMFPFTPGSGHKRSIAYFFYWFSFHNLVSQTYLRFRNKIFDSMDHRRVTIELTGQALMMLALAIYAGPSNWLWVIVLPIAIQNYLLMSYISTNHNMSPLTSENDPLINSLSVSNHPFLEFVHLNFGYHVEHHLYPMMSPKHAKLVHVELKKQFPDLYKIMPKWQAVKHLYSTPRIYKNAHELVHPETLKTYPTI